MRSAQAMKSERQPVTTRQAIQIAMQHHEAGRLTEAESIYRQVLEAEPANADALHLLGVIAHQSGNHEVAVELIEKAIGFNPANPFFLNNLGEALRELHRPREAESAYRRALALKADYAEAYSNLGNALKALRRLEEAEQSYRAAIKLNPALARAGLNYSLLQLLRGDYAAGFSLYENRFEGGNTLEIGADRDLLGELKDVPRWQGQHLEGRALLVWTEQGLGDSLMTMRYLPLLKDRGVGHLIVYCDASLVRIMQTIAGVDEVVSREHPVPMEAFHCHCPIMSLPLLFNTRLETIPGEMPYLRVPDGLRRTWADRLANVASPRIGLVWAGGKSTLSDSRRSVHLQRFAPLCEITGINFLSLQKGAEAHQLKQVRWIMPDWMGECGDLLDTAALVDQLDLVISVDTSIAHLAGAMGKPVWLLNRFESEWRWMLDREDSPWYPTMRIFRQSARGDWGEVIARIVSAIRAEFSPSHGKSALTPSQSASGAGKGFLWKNWISRLLK
jgi:Flp pilus assembly protein TadD